MGQNHYDDSKSVAVDDMVAFDLLRFGMEKPSRTYSQYVCPPQNITKEMQVLFPKHLRYCKTYKGEGLRQDILDGFKYLSIYISSPVVFNSKKTLFFLIPELANLTSFGGAAWLPPRVRMNALGSCIKLWLLLAAVVAALGCSWLLLWHSWLLLLFSRNILQPKWTVNDAATRSPG